jgi:hypothetical protein
MSDDALGLFQAMRPQAPGLNSDIRRGTGNLPANMPDLHNLAMVPGTPGYNARIPKPACFTCGEDHHPNVDYGHPWAAEPVHDEPVSASAIMRRPPPDVPVAEPSDFPAVQPVLQQRVALYVGRGDTYVIAVEQAPDWESAQTFKVQPEQVVPLIQMARALGVKVFDKTGGDLLMLEQEMSNARSKPAQDHGRGAQGDGSGQPRRQGPDTPGAEEDQPGEGVSKAG